MVRLQVRLMGASHDIMHELVTTDHFRGTKVVGNPALATRSLARQAHLIYKIYNIKRQYAMNRARPSVGITISASGDASSVTPAGLYLAVW